MHWLDLSIVILILLSGFISLFRGFFKEAVSLATWVFAVWASWNFSKQGAEFIPVTSIDSETIRVLIAFVAIFILVLIAGAVVNYLFHHLVKSTGFSGTDRMIGVVFGLLRGVLIVSLLVLLANLTNMPNEAWWQESTLMTYFQDIADFIKQWLPESWSDKFNPDVLAPAVEGLDLVPDIAEELAGDK